MVAVVEVTGLMETRVRARIAGKLFPRLFRKTRPPTGWQSEAVRTRIRLALNAIRASSTSDDDYSAASIQRMKLYSTSVLPTDRSNYYQLYLPHFNFERCLNILRFEVHHLFANYKFLS